MTDSALLVVLTALLVGSGFVAAVLTVLGKQWFR